MTTMWRSLLFVPADDQKRMAKVTLRGADAIILDLEDAIPLDRKSVAREGLPAAIDAIVERGCPVVVRVNSGWRDLFADLDQAIRPGVAAIMVPKVDDAARISIIGELIAEIAVEKELETPPGIIALIESPTGLADARSIAGTPSVLGVALGSEDFSLALNVPPSPAALDLPCRQLAIAAAERGIMALGLPISIATIGDRTAWEDAVARARAIGMTGALCIHPAQIAPLNDGFMPSADEIDFAVAVLAAWDAGHEKGVVNLNGRMIDLPVALAAKRTISRLNTSK